MVSTIENLSFWNGSFCYPLDFLYFCSYSVIIIVQTVSDNLYRFTAGVDRKSELTELAFIITLHACCTEAIIRGRFVYRRINWTNQSRSVLSMAESERKCFCKTFYEEINLREIGETYVGHREKHSCPRGLDKKIKSISNKWTDFSCQTASILNQ